MEGKTKEIISYVCVTLKKQLHHSSADLRDSAGISTSPAVSLPNYPHDLMTYSNLAITSVFCNYTVVGLPGISFVHEI
jgi:hypothetical protein